MLSRSFVFRLSPSARTALLSLALGFLTAVLVVMLGDLFSSVGLWGPSMYVEDDVTSQNDDFIQSYSGMRVNQLRSAVKLPKLGKLADGVVHEDTIAKSMSDVVRVLCVVMTTSESLATSAQALASTWGKRCNKLLFVSDKDGDVDGVPVVKIDRTSGTLATFDHIFLENSNDADWFLQVDDETYIVMENLRYFLSSLNSDDPIYFRHHFSAATQQGYLGSGSGYILSKEALKRFGSRSSNNCQPGLDAIDDRAMARCLRSLGVRTGDSRDALGRSRFHCFPPERHIHGEYPGWYAHYNKKGNQAGIDSMSDYAISFHFVNAEQFVDLEFYIYHLRPYGRVAGLMELNRPPTASAVVAAAAAAAGVRS